MSEKKWRENLHQKGLSSLALGKQFPGKVKQTKKKSLGAWGLNKNASPGLYWNAWSLVDGTGRERLGGVAL